MRILNLAKKQKPCLIFISLAKPVAKILSTELNSLKFVSIRVMINEIKALLDEGKLDLAEEKLQTLLLSEPENHAAHYQMACLHMYRQDFKLAEESVNTALSLDPKNANYLAEKGVIFIHQQKLNQALLCFDKALELEPNNPYRWSSRAFTKERFGDIKGAVADYRKALALDPDDMILYNNLGLAEEKLGYAELAQERFKHADKLIKNQQARDEVEKSNLADEGETNNSQDISPIKTEQKYVPKPESSGKKMPGMDFTSEEILRKPNLKDYFKVLGKIFSNKAELKEFLKFVRNIVNKNSKK